MPKFPRYIVCSHQILIIIGHIILFSYISVPPGPPTDIFISSTSTEANVTWREPPFIGEFFSENDFIAGIHIVAVLTVYYPTVSKQNNILGVTTDVLGLLLYSDTELQ